MRYQRIHACHVLDLLCNQLKVHFFSLCQTDLSKFSFQWLIFWFQRLFTCNFTDENNEFWFKSELKRQAHICKFAALWTKNNLETTRWFHKHFLWSLEFFAKQVSIQKLSLIFMQVNTLHWKNKVTAELEFSQTSLMLIFHLFHSGFSLKSKFVSLEVTCKTRAQKTRCSRRANFSASQEIHSFLAKLTACNLFQNICFSDSRKTRVASLKTRV